MNFRKRHEREQEGQPEQEESNCSAMQAKSSRLPVALASNVLTNNAIPARVYSHASNERAESRPFWAALAAIFNAIVDAIFHRCKSMKKADNG